MAPRAPPEHSSASTSGSPLPSAACYPPPLAPPYRGASPSAGALNAALLSFMTSHPHQLRTLPAAQFASLAALSVARTAGMPVAALQASATALHDRFRAVERMLPVRCGPDDVRKANVGFMYFSTMYKLFYGPLPMEKEERGRTSVVDAKERNGAATVMPCDELDDFVPAARESQEMAELFSQSVDGFPEPDAHVVTVVDIPSPESSHERLPYPSSVKQEANISREKQKGMNAQKRPRLSPKEYGQVPRSKEQEQIFGSSQLTPQMGREAPILKNGTEKRLGDQAMVMDWHTRDILISCRSKVLRDMRESAIVMEELGMKDEATSLMRRALKILNGDECFEECLG